MDCGTAPGVANGVLDNPSDTIFEDVATYTCDSGYVTKGEQQTRSSLANGNWSESDLVCQCKYIINIHHFKYYNISLNEYILFLFS